MKSADKYIRKNGSGWQVRVGSVSRTFPTRKEAREYRDALIQARTMHTDAPESTLPHRTQYLLSEWIERCMSVYGANLQPNTFIGYESKIRIHIMPSRISRLPVQMIRPSEVQTFVNGLKRKDGSKLSPKTVADIYGILSWALKKAVLEEIITQTPCRGIKLPSRTPPNRTVMTPETAKEILRYAKEDGYFDYVALCVLFCTGIRKSELLALRFSDFDENERKIRIVRKVELLPGRIPHISEKLKSESSKREILIPKSLAELIKAQARLVESYKRESLGLFADDGLMFPDRLGRVQTPDAFESRFRRLQERHGISPVVGLHGFRHHLATELILNGTDIVAVSAILGHTDPNFTRKQYQDLYDRQLTDAAEITGRLFESAEIG